MNAIRELIRFRELLYMLTWRDICIKYKQSILGLCWAVLMPAFIVLAGIVVKLAMAKISGTSIETDDIARVAVKSVPWAFFVASVRFGTNSLIGNSNLVTKIYFPRIIVPLSAVGSQLFDFCIASCVLGVVLLLLGVQPALTALWLPILLLLLVMQTISLSIFLSAAGLFFRDVKYLVEIILTFAIFFTPIFYEVSLFGEIGQWLLLNPVAPVFESIGEVVLDGKAPNLPWLTYSAVAAAAMLVGSFAFFRRVEPSFAECI